MLRKLLALSCVVAHNSIETAWINGAGIRLRDLPALGAAIERAIVVDNEVTMSAPEGTVFGAKDPQTRRWTYTSPGIT